MIPRSPVIYKMTSNYNKIDTFNSPEIEKNKGFYSILKVLDEKCMSYSKRSQKILEEHSIKKGSIKKRDNNQNFKERILELDKEFLLAEERTKKAFEIILRLKEDKII